MGKISDYTRVLAAKLADVFVVDQTDNGTTETKSATVEQIGTAIGTLQNFADLDTSNKNLVDAINEIASYTPVYGNTASGAIATFDTSLALPLQNCTIDINAVQEGSGTPSPQNVRNLVGFTGANIKVCGKNLFDKSTATTGKFYNAQGQEVVNANKAHSVFLKIKPSTTYYMSGYGGAGFYAILAYDENLQPIDNWYGGASKTAPFIATTPANARYCYLNFDLDLLDMVMFCEADSAQPYEAYNGTTYAISWNDEAGEIFGAKSNPIVGGLAVTYAKFKISDTDANDWSYYSVAQGSLFRYIASDMVSTPSGGIINAISDSYATVAQASRSDNTISGSPNTKNIDIIDNRYTSVEDFISNNPNIVIVYKLATPVTYQLTPTQINAIVGTNNVFTDTNGDTSVVYACSLKDYIEGQ